MEYLYVLWGVGGALAVAGLVLLRVARSADLRNYIVQRATPMPIGLVNERDDVWLRGTATSKAPLIAPHFGISCVHYSYTLEEHVTKTRRTKKGVETYQTWETRERTSRSARFELREGGQGIEIDGEKAEFEHCLSKSETLGKWRHTLRYIPSPSTVSAVGSVGEKKERLEPFANIPLIVTPKGRAEYVQSAERAERWMRGGGFALFWAGAGIALYGLFDFLDWPARAHAAFRWATAAVSVAGATFLFGIVWLVYIFNTFVTYRVRVENAWHQIDVDLKMRYDLIPQLLEAVKGHMKYEKDVLEHVTTLRGQALAGGRAERISADAGMKEGLSRMAVVAERYPDLKAQPAVQALFRELKAIEEKIAHGRIIYNEAVKEFNDNVGAMPRGLVARAFGFREQPFFRAEVSEKRTTSVAL